jgi:putative two-component system response regulator
MLEHAFREFAPFAAGPIEADGNDPPFRILIVDDDITTLGILRLVAGRIGNCECEIESSPQAALARCQADPPDLLVVDHVMPEMTGLTLVNSLRADPRTSSLACIAITGLHDPVLAELLRERGVIRVFFKPLDIAAFRSEILLVRATLRTRQSREALGHG